MNKQAPENKTTQNTAQGSGCNTASCYAGIIDDLKALRQLGMRCLTMNEDGLAYASEVPLELNKEKTGWKQVGWNPHADGMLVKKLNGYSDFWEKSIIMIDSYIKNLA